MTKQEIRKASLQKRLSLTEGEYLEYNRKLYDLFFSCVDLSFIQVLHTFLPIIKNKEPDTWPIIDRIRREFPQIQLSVPRISQSTALLENLYFEGPAQLQESKWGISEPIHGSPTPSEEIDMVLVPLLAYDKRGHRVGYGKGHYDRFLNTCRPNAKLIGLSFFDPLDEISEIESHDKPLNAVVTPFQYFQF
jgi:5-formyltetrahydrofolate cyclo-ligase